MKAVVSRKNAPATPRQLRWFTRLYLIHGVKRPTRGELDRRIKAMERAADPLALARLKGEWRTERKQRRKSV